MKPPSTWPVLGPAADPWQEPDASGDALRARIHAVLRGEAPASDPELARLAGERGLLRRLRPDPRSWPPAPRVPTLDEMIRVTTDVRPDVGDGPDRLLGPWADALDIGHPPHRRALAVALAATCFATLGGERSPFVEWCNRGPKPPPVADRAAFRAVDRAPFSAWRLAKQVGDRWELDDLVGLSACWVPTGLVRVEEPGAVCGGPTPGDALLARIVPTTDGPVAVTPLVVPGCPPEASLRAWIALEALDARIETPYVTREGLLRARGHVLARRVHEWAWVRRGPEA